MSQTALTDRVHFDRAILPGQNYFLLMIVMPTQVWWLVNPVHQGQEAERRNCHVIGSLCPQGEDGGTEHSQERYEGGGMWYRVELYPNEGPDCRCELFCGWGHIENKCGSKHACRNCSAHYRISEHKCNVMGSNATQQLLCGHTPEKCPNCKGNQVSFSSRCVKTREAT